MSIKSRILLASSWALLNLLISLFIVPVLPASFFRFLISFLIPAITAIIFTFGARENVRLVLRFQKSKMKFVTIAIGFPIVVALLTAAISVVGGYASFLGSHQSAIASTFFSLLLWIILAFGEEIGWRGFLQSHLAFTKHAPLIIGLIWAAWHFQSIVKAYPSKSYMLVVFTANAVLVSYFFSWLTDQSRSIVPAAISHGVWNFLNFKIVFGDNERSTSGLFDTAYSHIANMEGIAGLMAIALVSGIFIRKWYKSSTIDLLK